MLVSRLEYCYRYLPPAFNPPPPSLLNHLSRSPLQALMAKQGGAGAASQLPPQQATTGSARAPQALQEQAITAGAGKAPQTQQRNPAGVQERGPPPPLPVPAAAAALRGSLPPDGESVGRGTGPAGAAWCGQKGGGGWGVGG